MAEFIKRSVFACGVEALWAFHARAGAFERLMPPWQSLRVLESTGDFAHRRLLFEIAAGLARVRWLAQHQGCIEGREFRDRMVTGPMAAWEHTHTFVPLGEGRSELIDRIEYRVPGGAIGRVLGGGKFARDLERMFRFRHRRTAEDIARHQAAGLAPMRVAVTGASGYIGSRLVPFLLNGGHQVSCLVRPGTRAEWTGLPVDRIAWDPERGEIDGAALEGHDAVVHLAAAAIDERRWDARQRERISATRVGPTALLAGALAKLASPPRVVVSASGINVYSEAGGPHDESAPIADNFLAGVVRQWEHATDAAEQAGIRVVHLRMGVVMDGRGRALRKMVTPFQLGLGAQLGDGRPYTPWIAIDDVLGVVLHAISDSRLSGAVNTVSPAAVTSDELTRTLARVLGRPRLLRIPGRVLRAGMGGIADTVLRSCHATPRKLLEAGFRFRSADLEQMLRMELGRLRA